MTCQLHPYFTATIQGYLAVQGWVKCQDNDAIASKSYTLSGGSADVFLYLKIGGPQDPDHILTAGCILDGRNVLAQCRLPLPKTDPVFAVTIRGFVQQIDAAILAVDADGATP